MPKLVKWLQHIKGTHAMAFCVCSVDIPGPPLAYVSYPRDVTRTHNMSSSMRDPMQDNTNWARLPSSISSKQTLHSRCRAAASSSSSSRSRCRAASLFGYGLGATRVTCSSSGCRESGGKEFPPWNSLKSVNRDFRGRDFPPEFFFPSPGGRTELILPGT